MRSSPKPSSPKEEFAADELLISYEASVLPEERARVRAEHKLEKIQDLPGSGLEQVRILDGAHPSERAREVSKESSVRYAEPNFVSRTQG